MKTSPFAAEQLGPLADDLEAHLAALAAARAVERLWARDHTLWSDDPTGPTARARTRPPPTWRPPPPSSRPSPPVWSPMASPISS